MSDEMKLEYIYSKLNRETFSKNLAARIVGNKYELMRLVEQGKIRVRKPHNVQNGKWYCNAGDVLRCVQTTI